MCLFCKIIARTIPSDIVLENDHVLAFRDVNPVAPAHALVIPKKHIVGIGDATREDAALLAEVLLAAPAVAEKLGIASTGYRLVLNNGANAGQSVFHMHLHVMGGRLMLWPPG
jgi:histidine triad (HIT) family protein